MELQQRQPDLAKGNVTVVAVSYDPVPTLAGFAKARGITFPLLSDTGSRVITSLGLLNETAEKGTRSYGIPHPGTLVLDANRTVRARFFEERYQERNTAASIIVRQGGAGQGPSISAANPHVVVNAAASDDTVAPGSRITLAFDITPRPRMHVYAPGADYQVVNIAVDANPVLQPHDVEYPPSEIYHFEPLDERVPVYQKPFRLTRDVTVAATREAQQALRDTPTLTISGRLEYQACDDKICFQPAAVPFSFTLKVKPVDRP